VTETDDAAYLPRIAAGDTAAFGAWMTGAERPVRDSLRGFAGRVDTESVIQETFLRVWQVAPSIVSDGKPNNLVCVALRIARNLAISETRRLRTAAAYGEALEGLEGLDALGHGSSRPPDPMLRRLIAACRERLPARPAQALSARLQNEGSDADATLAEQLGMTRNTFLQNFTRARKLLAQCLAENGVDLDAELT
jgi:RNA polymerase sigma-70 factor (ECF subfamily)